MKEYGTLQGTMRLRHYRENMEEYEALWETIQHYREAMEEYGALWGTITHY